MELNEYASLFLDAFFDGEAPEEGMSHFAALQKLALTGTSESLERVDVFLLQLHRDGVADLDLDSPEVQNFLYLLAFYVGKVAGELAAAETTWLTWEVLIEANPGLEEQIPCIFGTSVVCLVGSALFLPLSAVMACLIDGEASGPSVSQSVQNVVSAARKSVAAEPLPPDVA